MALSSNQKQKIINLLETKIDNKLKKYLRESTSMPFLSRLMQDSKKVAAYSFIHSLATSLGMSIYEDVSKIIASENSEECFTKYGVGSVLSKDQKSVIANIVRELRNNPQVKSNIYKEMKEVLNASSIDGKFQKDGNIADFYMKRDNEEYYFEIKTVKPNIDVFKESKVKLLEWIARKRKPIRVFLVFPYNPYHPQPYSRFTMQNMMDHPNDFLIGSEYWDLLGGKNSFIEVLNIFDEVGKNYKKKISDKIEEVAKIKIESY
ncbi:TdeIII family type II restriction endonuclease [Patescibacteria group bacterium]|nr:TdeIII family type II restriction endonuclease [Patescibacteria group bacterium]MBU4017055.1 TdeIII family type II restriction endonuclease [Patescibacteria group bacterium]MBU4098740.1 TdeIII family type II restriction endonuclease [Patescibacteria group bacterium]